MGKRARVPTQKALMAKEALQMKGNSQRGRKTGQIEGKIVESSLNVAESSTKSGARDTEKLKLRNVESPSNQLVSAGIIERGISQGTGQVNETVPGCKDPLRQQHKQAESIWDGITRTSSVGSLVESSNSKKSWADEVEEETVSLGKKKSIWNDFDIAKLSNAGYKLEYVALGKEGDIVEIELEDISSEITYWGNAMVCYVLGAHPPFQVIQGYIQRLWGKYGIDKVAMLRNGVLVMLFETKIGKQEILQGAKKAKY
ncbi:hypothetical protein H5410_016602 [Solanum commersonii]|uniref:DUF4283 domain-containing protein n=1 Tax=Solanum commersonii TaxID=4109 RepID=A0A9J5ZXT0_SOLCO|nr:hypothetical protein H5410_016602 [Solanum commersonii]